MSETSTRPAPTPSGRKYHGGGVFSKMQGMWRKGEDGTRHPVMVRGKDGRLVQKMTVVYYIRFRLADGRPKVQEAGTTLSQAREQLVKVKGQVLAGTYVNPREEARRLRAERASEQERLAKRLKFEALVERFLAEYHPRGGDRSIHYKIHTVALKRYLGDLYVDDISVEDVDRFVTMRRAEKWRASKLPRVGDSTLRKDLIALGTIFRWAIARGLARTNPAAPELVKRPPEPTGRHRWLLEDEFHALVERCPAWLADIVTWACYSGMDRGQILTLKWSDLVIQKGPEGQIVGGRLALPRGKTGKVSRFVFSAPLLEVLNRRRTGRLLGGLVFHEGDGVEINPYRLEWALRCALKAANLSEVTFKSFRHTAATWALRRGIPVKVVSDMLGQSAARTTEIYLHTADDQLEAAARAMGSPDPFTVREPATQTAT